MRRQRPAFEALTWPVVIAGLALLCLAPTAWAPFFPVADRARLLLNPSYQGFGASQLAWILASFHPGHLYEPISWLSYAVDYDLWKSNPVGFQLQSLTLHAANAALLYWIGKKLLDDRLWAAASALIFSLHPMRVEAVGWLSARPYLLSSFFALSCILFYLRADDVRTRSRPWLAASLAAFGLAMAAQPFAAGVPAVLLLLDRRLGRPRVEDGSVWNRTAGYWLILYFFATVNAAARDLTGPPSGFAFIGLDTRLARVFCAPAEALARTFWPFHLSPLLPQSAVGSAHILVYGLVAVLVTAEIAYRRHRGAAVVWLSFLALLLPYALFDPDSVSGQALRFGDRWAYLPSAALALGLMAGLQELCRRSWLSRLPGRSYAWLLLPLALGPITFRSARAWANPETLLAANLASEPDCFECASTLAETAAVRGDTATAERFARQAAGMLRDVQVKRGDWQALFDRGIQDVDRGELDEGLDFLLAGIALNSGNPVAHFKAGIAYDRKGDLDHALEQTQAAVALDPDMVDARNSLGLLLERKGRYVEAVAQFQEVLKRAPKNQPARDHLAAALSKLGLRDAEIQPLINRGDWQGLFNRGMDTIRRGALDDGLAFLLASISVNPSNAFTRFQTGYVYGQKGDFDHAIEQTQAAVALDPNMVDARNNLGFFLEQKGRYREAVAQFHEVLRLVPGNQLARNNLAAAFYQLTASGTLRQALISQGDWQTLYNQGLDAVGRGALDDGLEFLLASTSANAHVAIVRFQAGYVYSLKGDVDHALEQTQAAVALDPNMVDARNNLGFFLEQKGRYREAVAQFQEALKRAPGNQLARNNLAAALAGLAAQK